MSRVYLGELQLYWCTQCNLPILAEKCGKCSSRAIKVDITPPGDIRPAFEFDLNLIRKIVERDFGDANLIPRDKLVVLNKVPFEDRMDEIILDGKVIGSLRFEPLKLDWVFLPRLSAARRMNVKRRYVKVDEGAAQYILKTANVLGPGVIDADSNIKKGDEVIVFSEDKPIAVGRARMNGLEMLKRERGIAVKTRWSGYEEEKILLGGQSWSDAVEANEEVIASYEAEAIDFIKKVVENTNRPVTVSYSGGKDSLVTLLLVKKAIEHFDVIFVDTGLEFEETKINVLRNASKYGLNLLQASVNDAFWINLEHFGPPSVEARWCCKVCKLAKVTQLIDQNYPRGCLTFIGQRKYESELRSRSQRIWKNPWVGNQVSASPIQNWTALHIWLYIFREKAEYNPLYEKGFDRIGCWLCPASSLAEFERIREIIPSSWEKWELYLKEYARKMNLPEEWVKYGFWRWRKYPPAQRRLMAELGIELEVAKVEKRTLEFNMISGYTPCAADGWIYAEGSFGIPLDLDRVFSMLKAIGVPRKAEGLLYLSIDKSSLTIYASGTVTVRSREMRTAMELMEKARKSILRALKCSKCGICAANCSAKAIEIKEEVEISNRCKHCGKCMENCPAVKYG
ncbi:MAG: phosphoadenosine phosphosulfate reductase family protein [Methanocellales archaeon]